ncbi:MAG TPA: anaerobic sulfatase maturase [Bacteroidales bacterium]|nr:anaerobic sulfatase maturase [Bacteroidales bacterium]
MTGSNNEFQVFIKPVGAICNLSCSYCYYLGKKELYEAKKTLMSDEVLEKCIRDHFEATSSPLVTFSWHGGEPLLAGIDFYRKAGSIQRKLAPRNVTILNGIQTNGTLLTEEWCRFLAEEKFFVGISIDGPEHLHNVNRVNIDGLPSFGNVIGGFRLLKRYGINTEILCVVNSMNVDYPLEVYNFFKSLDASMITFLPLVERVSDNGSVSSCSVPAKKFGVFLSEIFDEWIRNDIGKIKVQVFEEALRTAFNQDHTLCIFKKDCGAVPVLEHNGDFYACDHFVNAEHYRGNIMETPLADLLSSKSQAAFGCNKSLSLPGYCRNCEVLSMCNGECPRNRFIMSPGGEYGLNYLCEGYKYFFNHCYPFVEAVRKVWLSNNSGS